MAVAVLCSGIACSVALFRVLDRLLLSPPAGIRDAHRLWEIAKADESGSPRSFFSYSEVTAVASALGDEQIAAFTVPDSVSISAAGRSGNTALPTRASSVSTGYFQVLGVAMVTGRGIAQEATSLEAPVPVVVLNHSLWQRLGGATGAPLGTEVRIGARLYTLIGVASADFIGIDQEPAEAWLPLGAAGATGGDAIIDLRSGYFFRLAAHVATPSALARARSIIAPALLGVPEPGTPLTDHDDKRILLRALNSPRWGSDGLHFSVVVLLATVCGAILLIACGNAASLLLARAIRLSGDSRLQLALGAPQHRVLLQQGIEMGHVVLLASIGGILAGEWMYVVVYRLLAPDMLAVGPRFGSSTVAFDLVLIAIVTALTLCIPLLHVWKVVANGTASLLGRENQTPSLRWQKWLMTLQAGLCFALLVGAGLFVQSFRETLGSKIGVRIRGLLYADLRQVTGDAMPPGQAAMDDVAMIAGQAEHWPNVRAVAIGSALPLKEFTMVAVDIPELSRVVRGRLQGLYATAVTPSYFSAVGATLLAGRQFTDGDRLGAPLVAIINRTMASTAWPGGDAIGQCIGVGPPPFRCHRVIGVIEDPPALRLRGTAMMQYFVAAAQRPEFLTRRYLFVRYDGKESAGIELLRARLGRETPNSPVVGSLSALADREVRPLRVASAVLAIASAIGLLLAGVGAYATTLYHLRCRSREFGIRIALGSPAGSIFWLLTRDVVFATTVGGIAGAAVIAILSRFLTPLLFKVSVFDPRPYALASLFLLASTMATLWSPARLATRMNIRDALSGPDS